MSDELLSGFTDQQHEEQHFPSETDEEIQINPGFNTEEDERDQTNEEWQPSVRVTKVGQKFVRKFQTKGTDYFVRIDNLEGQNHERLNYEILIQKLTESLQRMIDEVLNGIPNNHFVRLMINNHFLHNPIYIPFDRRNRINVEAILEAIKKYSILMKNF